MLNISYVKIGTLTHTFYSSFINVLFLIIIANSGCITGEQELCPDSVPDCGNSNMPPAALGSICVSDCTDFNGALYCLIDGGGWGWCADQTGSCGNGQNETGKRQIQRKNVSV